MSDAAKSEAGAAATTGSRQLVYVLPALAYGLWLSLAPLASPLTEPDTASYLGFSSSRTAGYPYFLWAVEWLFGDPKYAIHVQVWVFAAALAVLGRVVLVATGSSLFTLGLLAANCINPEVNRFHFVLLTESLFVSLTILIIACLIQVVYRPDWRGVACLSALMGLAVALRPVGYAFLPLLVLIALIRWRELRPTRAASLAALVLPVVAVVLLETAVYAGHHGLPRKSLAGVHAIGKAGVVRTSQENPYPADHAYHRLWAKLEEAAAAAHPVIDGAPTFGARKHLGLHYEAFMQYIYARDEIEQAAHESGFSDFDVMKQVGLERLFAAPLSYLRLSLDNLRGLWLIYGASHPTTAEHLNAYVEANSPLPLFADYDITGPPMEPVQPRRIALFVQPAVLALCAVTLIAIFAAAVQILRGRAKPALIVAGLCGLMVNGNFLLVALTGIGIVRYTLAMWPGMMACAAFLAWPMLALLPFGRRRFPLP